MSLEHLVVMESNKVLKTKKQTKKTPTKQTKSEDLVQEAGRGEASETGMSQKMMVETVKMVVVDIEVEVLVIVQMVVKVMVMEEVVEDGRDGGGGGGAGSFARLGAFHLVTTWK